MTYRQTIRGRVLVVLLLFCIVGLESRQSVSAQDVSSETIDIPEVYAHIEYFRRELESLRLYIGRPKEIREELRVQSTEPREVFFQAVTLFQKADRLSFEIARTRGIKPTPPSGKIQPEHVYAAVNDSLMRVQAVKRKIGLELSDKTEVPDASNSSDDVFRSIVQANRQLNLMLERQFSPSDVFQQVTVAIAYAERLIERFPDVDSTVPSAPKFEPNKMPKDVYQRLEKSFRKIQTIMAHAGEKSLILESLSDEDLKGASPSDVYDIVSLVVSELAYLHKKLPNASSPRKAYFPGRKFPAHVYQRVGILEQQLDQLEKLTRQPVD